MKRAAPLRDAAAVVEPILGRTARRKLAARKRILAAARELFVRKGFAATTTGEIATAADVGKGSIFLQAGSKERLLVMVFQEDLGRWVETAFANPGAPPLLDQMERAFTSILRQVALAPELAAVLMNELPHMSQDPGVAAVTVRIDALLGSAIDAAKLRHEVDEAVDTFILGRNLLALYFWFQVQWLGDGLPALKKMVPTLRQQLSVQLTAVKPTAMHHAASVRTSTRNRSAKQT